MLVDNRYTGDYTNDQYSYAQQTTDQNGHGAYGQTDYPASATNGNKEEEGMYSKAPSVQTGTVKSPYSVQPGNTHPPAAAPQIDARQDSLIGPLLAELDSLSNQQQPQAPSAHSRTSVAYQSNVNRQNGTSQPDYGSTDVFMPSTDTADPDSHYNQYEPDHQTFQSSSQHYNTAFDQTRKNTNPFINHAGVLSEPNPSNNDQLFYTDSDSSRQQAPGNAQRANPKNRPQQINGQGPDKSSKKRDLPARSKGATGSGTTSTSNGAQQSSLASQSPRQYGYLPPVSTQSNYIEKNIDMIKHKENYYHRYPAQKYANMYAKRKFLQGESDYDHSQDLAHQSTFPLTINLSTGDPAQNGSTPATVDIPLDNYMNHAGENVSVDINLRLHDDQNPQQQQQQQQYTAQTERQGADRLHRTTTDALDRHIRKMERNIHENLPATNSSQRPQLTTNTNAGTFTGRLGKTATGSGYTGYSSLPHARDVYTYSDKVQEDDSYLAQMHQSRRSNDFKPYTVRDYDRFKKNSRFGTGCLGFDGENTTYREKVEKATKVKEYAQQIEARNKKMISEVVSRTSLEIPSPMVDSKTPRNGRLSKRTPRYSSKSTHSSPVSMTKIVPLRHAPASPHRVMKVVHHVPSAHRLVEMASQPTSARRPVRLPSHSPPVHRLVEVISPASSSRRQPIRFRQHDEYEVVESNGKDQDRDVTPVNRRTNPSKKRREQNDENDSPYMSSPASNRTITRRLSPVKLSSPTSRINSDNVSKRRPLRFDNLPVADEPRYASPELTYVAEQQKRRPSADQPDHAPLDNETLMKVIRDELTERPLEEGEELVVIE